MNEEDDFPRGYHNKESDDEDADAQRAGLGSQEGQSTTGSSSQAAPRAGACEIDDKERLRQTYETDIDGYDLYVYKCCDSNRLG